jgi:Putative beta-barrel porin 2
MRRSGALTLGVVLTLGGVTGGRGQELSGSLAASNAPPLDGFVMPTLPDNWADLPFTLRASQNVSYNSNINGIPLGSPVPAGESRGDFTAATNVGFSTKSNVYGQQLYLDTTFGVIRYHRQTRFNSNIYSVNAGDNWTLTSRCAGALGVSLSKTNSTLLTTLVGTGVNYETTTSFNETGKCAVSNGFSLLFNSSWTELTNSNPVDALLNSRATMLSAGIEYAKGSSTVTVLATNTENIFSRPPAVTATGLANVTDFHSFTLGYSRQINPNLSVNGLIGLVGTTTNAFTLGLPRTLLPIYTLGTTWTFTPKLSLNASASRTVSPPTTIIANAEIAYTATVDLGYQITPKLAFNVNGSISHNTGAATRSVLTALAPFLTGASNFYSASTSLSYTMTPFLSAHLTASYTERVANHTITPEDLIIASLRYSPH